MEINTSLTAGNTTQNRVIKRDWVDSGNAKSQTSDVTSELVLGGTDALVFWIKKASSTDADVDLMVEIEEEW